MMSKLRSWSADREPTQCRTTIDALEEAHSLAVAKRERLMRRLSPSGTFAGWDAAVPLNGSSAWEAYTVWDLFAPTYGCQQPSAVGGMIGDTAEWDIKRFPLESKQLCNMPRLRQQRKCVVYAFGTGWDVSFELDILRIAPHCIVRSYDPTVSPKRYWQLVRAQMATSLPRAAQELHDVRRRLTFKSIGLGNASEGTWHGRHGMLWNNAERVNVTSVAALMAANGDAHIDVLKMDVEGVRERERSRRMRRVPGHACGAPLKACLLPRSRCRSRALA